MATVTLTATFTTAGTFTWTAPAGVTSVTAACTGAGGGAGAAATASGSNGGGGGGGAAALEPAVGVTPGVAYVVTVGAGGAGGTAGAAGAAGGLTTFNGDTQGVFANGGLGGGAAGATGAGAGAAGGGASANTVSASGGNGDDGTAATNGGGGGGAAGASTTTAYTGANASGSTAGAASLGTYPGGAGGAGSTSGSGPGSNGTAPGGGGGGALSTGTQRAGGSGANGQVVLTWTQTDPVTLSASTAGSVTQFQAPLGAATVTAQAWGSGAGGWSGSAGGSIVGATVSPQGYSTTDNLAAANIYDGFLGGNRVPALTMQKWYFSPSKNGNPSELPTTVPAGMAALSAAGVKFLVSFSPGGAAGQQANTAAELTRFVACMQALIAGGVSFDACFWQEPNNTKAGFTAASYISLVNYYWTTTDSVSGVAANTLGINLVYNSAGHDPVGALAYYPGKSLINGGICVDYYCMSDFGDHSAPPHIALDQFAAQADNDNLPFGLGEWGPSALSTALPSDFFSNGWPAYISYLISFFTPRTNRYAIMYYSGLNPNGNNVVQSASDPRVAGIQQVYDAISGGSPAGGMGGGGGEFAQESSLAVTSLKNYTVVVGAGGGGKKAGASSTIAGDSVTVTAHGGGVGSSSGGGAGGTGSGNTTHRNGGAGGTGGVAGAGGAGGGGSGGTASAGNAGFNATSTIGAAGAAAVTGGGPGGQGGTSTTSGSPPVTGPGGGGGGRGAAGNFNGTGADGQITLSSFVINPAGTGSFALAPLALSGTAVAPAASYALAPLALSGTANVCVLPQKQNGTTQTGTTTNALTLPLASTAGTLLIAVMASGGTTALTGPAGWSPVARQAAGGASGRLEMWFYNPGGDGVTGGNPGGITSATFTGGAGDNLRGHMAEYSPPSGYTAVLDGTPGTASGTGATSFPVSTSGSSAGGDLGLFALQDVFSANPGGSLTPTPSGWTVNRQQSSTIDWWASDVKCGLSAGTQSVTGQATTMTNETGWSAILACFKVNAAVTSTGSLALAPLALSGAGSAVVGPTQNVSSGGLALAPIGFQSPSQATTFPASPLPIKAEILLNGTWTDITHYLYQRDGVVISSRGRPDEASTVQPTQVTLTLNNRDGSFSPYNTTGEFYPFLTRNTQIRISVVNAVTTTGANYNGNGANTGQLYRFWGEVPAWPPRWDPTQTDVYITVTAAGILQRLQQSKSLSSPVARYYANRTGALVPAGYWPCEDGTAATSFASGIPGGSPMTWSGTPGLAADSNVTGSAPFAELTSSVWTGTPGAFTSGGVTYATPGTYQWVCPGGVTSVQAECWGGGGGGSDGRFGCGGGGGEYASEPSVAVTPGVSYTVTVGAAGNGGSGTFSLNGNPGATGGPSTFTGDVVTVMAHPGKGLSSMSGTAPGGAGSTNTTHHSGGRGGTFRSAGQGGSGGGGSGGSAAGGNNGQQATSATGAAGGAAVTGGGPGGTGGLGAGLGGQALAGNSPSPGPGGGGGGGGFNQRNQFGERGGNGYAGQVKLTFGTSTTPTANVLRFILDVPNGGGVDGAFVGQILTSGTIADLHVIWHTGGNLELVGKNAGGTQLFTSGSQAFGALGTATAANPMLVSAELTQSGTSVKWKLTAVTPNATTVVATFKGTQTNATIGAVTTVNVNNASGKPDTGATGIGHVAVQYAVDPILNLAPALAAYSGERAATRFLRLCAEQNVPTVLVGVATDTPQMGTQATDTLVNLLQACESADLGLIFEPRNSFGLGYRTRVSLQNQAAAAIADYSKATLAQPLNPTDDDQLTHNDIQVNRTNGNATTANGSSYVTTLTTGPMSNQAPPNGVGDYSYQVQANLLADSQLANFAAWLLTIGTVDEFRYPIITFDMARTEVQDGNFSAIPGLDIGDFLQIVNPPVWLPGPINQLCYGFTETLNAYVWTIAINAVPEDPYTATNSSGPLPTW